MTIDDRIERHDHRPTVPAPRSIEAESRPGPGARVIVRAPGERGPDFARIALWVEYVRAIDAVRL